MPSNAYKIHLKALLHDAQELDDAHTELSTGKPGRQYKLASINRAIVVICISAWESYIEELVRESMTAIAPTGPTQQVWTSLNTYVTFRLKKFNTPNKNNVKTLLFESIGIQDIHTLWSWQKCSSPQAVKRLDEAMELRHKIAHGVNPRPVIHNMYAGSLAPFIERLARCTDVAVRSHLIAAHGIATPWP
ncbi:HEPN domain-containing protein [Lacunimicrobium album]